MANNNEDRINAYLRHEMSQSERVAFEKDLKSDESLRHDYELTCRIKEALSLRKDMMHKLNQWEEEEAKNEKQDNYNVKKRFMLRHWMIGLSVAACIAGAIIVLRPLFFPDYSKEIRFSSMPSQIASASKQSSSLSITTLDSLIATKEYSQALIMVDSISDMYKGDISTTGRQDSIYGTGTDSQQMLDSIYQLEWRRIQILNGLDRRNETLDLLKPFREHDGMFKSSADSLYHVLIAE